MRYSAGWLVIGLGVLGCGKKSDAYMDVDWTKQVEQNPAAWREAQSLFAVEESDANRGSYTLRGVRHDLTIAKGVAVDERCSCLDVVVGPPDDARLRWAAEVPIIAPDEIALAVRTEGSQCGLASVERRPSIYAVDHTRGNTIVVIEELPADRPQALGAIVPLPDPGAGLYVRSRRFKDHVLPYAQGPAVTSGLCKVMKREGPRPGPKS